LAAIAKVRSASGASGQRSAKVLGIVRGMLAAWASSMPPVVTRFQTIAEVLSSRRPAETVTAWAAGRA
jgi:hypothetical protein